MPRLRHKRYSGIRQRIRVGCNSEQTMRRLVAACLDAHHSWASLSPVLDTWREPLVHVTDKMRDAHGRWNDLATGKIRVWEFADPLDEENPTLLLECTFVEGQCMLMYQREHLPE